jgi:hypothetical protein
VTWHAPAYRFLSHSLPQAAFPSKRLQKTRDIGSSKVSNSEQFATIVRSILPIEKAVRQDYTGQGERVTTLEILKNALSMPPK